MFESTGPTPAPVPGPVAGRPDPVERVAWPRRTSGDERGTLESSCDDDRTLEASGDESGAPGSSGDEDLTLEEPCAASGVREHSDDGCATRTPPGWRERHALAAALEGAPPGVTLAQALEGLEVADLDDAALVETVAAWERLASWAAARQARAIAELAARRPAHRSPFVSDEVAARLTVTRAVADGKVALALGMDRLPEIGTALAAGHLDVRRATVLTEELARVPEHVAQELATDAVARAVDATPPQLRNRLRRLELLRDPEGVVVRHRRACEQRRVELTPAADAMAWLTAYLPATDAVAVQTTLTALAQDTDRDEDARTLDQRRADALVDLATRWLDAGTRPDGGPLMNRQGRAPHLTITATVASVLALADMPAALEGYGVIPAALARQVAARATWEPLLLDARTGAPLARSTRRYAPTQALRDAVVQRDGSCRFPGCRRPAGQCDIDHVEPFRDASFDESQAGLDQGEPQTRIDNLQALCRRHHRAKTHGGWQVSLEADGSRRWTAPSGHVHVQHPEHPVLDSLDILDSLDFVDPLDSVDSLDSIPSLAPPFDPDEQPRLRGTGGEPPPATPGPGPMPSAPPPCPKPSAPPQREAAARPMAGREPPPDGDRRSRPDGVRRARPDGDAPPAAVDGDLPPF